MISTVNVTMLFLSIKRNRYNRKARWKQETKFLIML